MTPERLEDPSKAFEAGERMAMYVRPAVVVFLFLAGGFLIGAGSVSGAARVAFVTGLVLSGALVMLGAVVARDAFWVSLASYLAFVGVGARLQSIDPKPKAALIVIAAGSVLAAVTFMWATIRRGRQNTELERMVFAESTSVAFFMTMIGSVTYALLEAWIDAPKLSMWLVWTLGMGSWAIGSLIIQKRYS